MKAVSGGIKKHSITLKKGDTIFLEGGVGTHDGLVKIPLLYCGTHAQTGHYMVEHKGTMHYVESPIVGSVIPAEYMDALFEVFDVAFDTGATQPSSVDGEQPYDFGAKRAQGANGSDEVTLQEVLRATAKDIEDNVFGETVDGAILILRLPEQDNYIYRNYSIGTKECVFAFEDCKMKALGYVHQAELVQYED